MTAITKMLKRYLFIFLATYYILIGGSYYYQVFAVRVFQHVFSTILLSVWLILRLYRRRGLPSTPLNPLLYIGVIVWFASAVFSLDPRMALENLWFPVTNLLIFYVIVDLLQSGREGLLIETELLLAALVVIFASIQLGSWFFGWGFATASVGWASVLGHEIFLPLSSPRLFVPLGVSTWLAAYTAPMAIFAGASGLAARRRGIRNALLLLAVLLVLVMLLTASRGGWVSFGAGVVVFLVLRVLRDVHLRQFALRYKTLLMLIGGIVVASAVLMLARISAESGHATGDILRFDLWHGAVEIAQDHPFLGVGPGLFGRAYRLYRVPTTVDNRLGTAHNFYLNTLAETGIVGVLVGIALGFVLLRSWWMLWLRAESEKRQLHLEGALAALIGFGAQSLFDTFTSEPLVLLALSLAAYCVTETRLRGMPSVTAPTLKRGRAAGFASLVLVIGFGAGLLRSDQAQAAFNTSVRDASPEQALLQAQQAVMLDPALNLYRLQVAYQTDGDTEPAIASYQNALALEPTWDSGWINLAALYTREGETMRALDALQRAIDVDNHNGALLMWARLAEATGSAPAEVIRNVYAHYLLTLDRGTLPLSTFWSATDLRDQVLADYLRIAAPDVHYRVTAVHHPSDLVRLVPDHPVTAADWWVVGEYALSQEVDPAKAERAFTQAIDREGSIALGDYYASRARARLPSDPAGAARDLDIAELLGTFDESPSAIRARMATTLEEQRRLWAAAVPPRVIEQNFEGVLFGGRVGSFDLLPEMRLPGPGRVVMQPWYDLAASYLSTGQLAQAADVYRAILDRVPEEEEARAALNQLVGSAS